MDRDEFDKLLRQRLDPNYQKELAEKEERELARRPKSVFTVGRMTKDGWKSEKESWES